MTGFWLVRHGQTDWNLAGRWQGQSPDAPPLNQTGRAQVLALRGHLKNLQVSAIYSSDLLRSRETAEIIAKQIDRPVILDTRLREMGLGLWEGMCSDEIQARYPQELAERLRDPLNACAPQGESPRQVAGRVAAAANEIGRIHLGGSVLIVAHGISLAILVCLSQGISLEKVYEYVPPNAKLLPVEWKLSESVLGPSRWQSSGKVSLSVGE
jgi:broad specificity phosphatase PhoE